MLKKQKETIRGHLDVAVDQSAWRGTCKLEYL
jgi:hypothetical protein